MSIDVAMNAQINKQQLGAILENVPADAAGVVVTGIAYDSRRVQPGDLFFAIPGERTDGLRFASQAVASGAVAIVAEGVAEVNVPVVVVDSVRRAMADASRHFWGHPDRAMQLVGTVGTNGKSTVASGLHHVWRHSGLSAGLMGTLAYEWSAHSERAERTTPESRDLIELLARMRDDKVASVALEVSSHALALDRVWGLSFAGAVFTNFTRDHLDYHKSMEEYRRVKGLQFERLDDGAFAAINVDDPSAEYFLSAAGHARTIRYSVSDAASDVYLGVTGESFAGTRGELRIEGKVFEFASPLWGTFNHANLAAIAAAAYGSGCSGDTIVDGLTSFSGIHGRAEYLNSSAPFFVFIDFAHTPDALDAVLSAARKLVSGRLLVLFGCGGDRDRGKRPEMAQAVERWADVVYLTSDNPRSEDPLRIIDDVQQGFSTGTQVWCDPDRVHAIERSIADAQPGDVVFLCGKGHETTQDIAGVLHQMSDRDTAARALVARGHALQTSKGGGTIPG